MSKLSKLFQTPLQKYEKSIQYNKPFFLLSMKPTIKNVLTSKFQCISYLKQLPSKIEKIIKRKEIFFATQHTPFYSLMFPGYAKIFSIGRKWI